MHTRYKIKLFLFFLVFSPLGFANTLHSISIKEKTADYSLDIKYPQGFSMKEVDESIKKLVVRQKNNFIHSVPKATAFADIPGTNELNVVYKIPFQNDKVISVLMDVSMFFRGAAHPNPKIKTLNFIQGHETTLNNLFTSGDYLPKIAGLCREDLLKRKCPQKDMVISGTEAKSKNYILWNFDKKGLGIIFDTYQVAPYVCGPQTVIIPKETLKKALKEDVYKAVWGE